MIVQLLSLICLFADLRCTSLPTSPSVKFEPRDQIPCYMSCKQNYAMCIKREELVAHRFIFRNYRLICRKARTICELTQCNRYLDCLNTCRVSLNLCMGPDGPKDTQQSDVLCFQSNYLCKLHCRHDEITSPYKVVDHT